MQLDFASLYQKYDKELYQLACCLRPQYHKIQRQGYLAAFGDVEGELVYMLIRETRPETVFEISSAAGWSTNYILAALTRNSKGVVHGFELSPKTRGKPTEQVIRNNQYHDWDQDRLVVHIGDAQKITATVNANDTIDFLLLDSCHEDWFAQWYIEALLPRVNGSVIIQDIAFVDQLELSSEAEYVWMWLKDQKIDFTLFGSVETALEDTSIRTRYPERRNLRSNAILFCWPQAKPAEFPELAVSPDNLVEQAQQAIRANNHSVADQLLNEAVYCLLRMPSRANRHRLLVQIGLSYIQLGEVDEARRCFQRALGVVTQGDIPDRIKGYTELLELFGRHRQWKLMAQTGALMLLEPRTWPRVIQRARALLRRILKIISD